MNHSTYCIALLIYAFCFSPAFSQPPVVFPLQTGDWWLYYSYATSSNEISRVVADTIMPNGLTYKIVDVVHFADQYLRVAGAQVLRYWPYSNTEFVWCDFSRSPGEVVGWIPPSGSVVLSSRGQDTLFGLSRRYWAFSVDYNPNIVDDEEYYVVTDSIGVSWKDVMLGGGNSYRLRGAVLSGRAWGTPTGVLPPENLPHAHTLLSNFPNPFNSTTNIVFSLSSAGPFTITIHDLLGRIVSEVCSGSLDAGEHSIIWDANSLASGLYICQMVTTQSLATTKLMLLR
jgi:hypothetical protein